MCKNWTYDLTIIMTIACADGPRTGSPKTDSPVWSLKGFNITNDAKALM